MKVLIYLLFLVPILILRESNLSISLSFEALSLDLDDPFYYNKDDNSGDVFGNKLAEKK